jgi:hypothetical protein
LLLGNSSGVLARIAEGWQVSWIYNWTSGPPVQVSSQRSGLYANADAVLVNPQAFDGRSGKVTWETDAVAGAYFTGYSHVRDPQCSAVATSLQTLCTLNALVDSSGGLVFRTPKPGELGNYRDQIFGPGDWDLDAAISKRVRINERMSLEVRVDGTNILNHPQPANPNLSIQGGASTFGAITSKTGTFVQFSGYGRVFQARTRLTW